MNLLVTSFYTPGPYAEEAEEFLYSCGRHLKSAFAVDLAGPFASWNEAVSFKPQFILECFTQAPEYDGYLWVDIDARFRRELPVEDLEFCDLGAHFFRRSPRHGEEILTGTLYVANTPKMRAFVCEWAGKTRAFRHTDTPEQHSLRETLKYRGDDIAVARLGPEWCWIFDDFPKIYGDRSPIIEHFQASRRLRVK